MIPNIKPLPGLPGVKAFTTGRSGEGRYGDFNICHYTGDSREHTEACRLRLARFFGVEPERVVVPRQTHSVNVAVITAETPPTDTEGVDALVTRSPGIVIGINTADCVAVAMSDPVSRVIAVAHAGWRGAVGGILRATVEAMSRLGAEPSHIHASLAPSIGPCCFEVGEEVAAKFPQETIIRHAGSKPHVDLPAFVAIELQRAGVKAITTSGECTRCHPDRYFSARASGIDSGRNFTCIMLDN